MGLQSHLSHKNKVLKPGVILCHHLQKGIQNSDHLKTTLWKPMKFSLFKPGTHLQFLQQAYSSKNVLCSRLQASLHHRINSTHIQSYLEVNPTAHNNVYLQANMHKIADLRFSLYAPIFNLCVCRWRTYRWVPFLSARVLGGFLEHASAAASLSNLTSLWSALRPSKKVLVALWSCTRLLWEAASTASWSNSTLWLSGRRQMLLLLSPNAAPRAFAPQARHCLGKLWKISLLCFFKNCEHFWVRFLLLNLAWIQIPHGVNPTCLSPSESVWRFSHSEN